MNASARHAEEVPAPPRASSKRPIVMVGPAAPASGGMATVVDNLSHSALGEEFELLLVNTAKTTPSNRPWHAGVRAQLRLLRRLGGLLRQHPGALVHVHTCSGVTFWRDAVIVRLARWLHRPVLLHIHGGGFEQFVLGMSRIERAFLKSTFAASTCAIVLSDEWRRRLAGQVSARAWTVVPNGVPLPALPVEGPRTDAFLFVGNLDPQKGVHDLVLATAAAARAGFAGRIRLAGSETAPGQQAALYALAEREHIRDRVELMGVVAGRRKAEAYETACAFVLPSYVEALPMSLLEAMSYGLPVIASAVGAIPEVVTDGVEGFLITPGDVQTLADRMTQLSMDAELRRRMGSAGRRRVERHYTVEAMASSIASMYRNGAP